MVQENYAFIKENIVTNIVVFDNPSEETLNHFKNEFNLDQIILATDKTEINGTYDGLKFWAPQPYPSWLKGSDDWEPPVPMPEELGPYTWNEETLSWDIITPITD